MDSQQVEPSDKGRYVKDELIATIKSTIASEIGGVTEEVTNTTELSELG